MVAGDGGQLVHFVTLSLLSGLFFAVKTAFEFYLLSCHSVAVLFSTVTPLSVNVYRAQAHGIHKPWDV